MKHHKLRDLVARKARIREDEQRRAKAEQERWAGRGPSGFRSYY